tara:strand:- start:1623 stop:2246 length:624 start_codon:yes stop_codon:yes gene_type:complete
MEEKALIIDIPTSNVGSIKNAIFDLGYKSKISSDLEDIKKFNKIILPGHGTFSMAKKFLLDKKIFHYLKNYPKDNFFLGICVGMQLLGSCSYEEEKNEGLDLIKGEVKKITCKTSEKLPHIGWNQIEIKNRNSDIIKEVSSLEENNVYFSHSYSLNLDNTENLVCSTPFGQHGITSIVQKENIFGIQFHPEKSSFLGKKILQNFLDL